MNICAEIYRAINSLPSCILCPSRVEIKPTGNLVVKSAIFQGKAFFNCMMPRLANRDRMNFIQAILEVSYSRIKLSQSKEMISEIKRNIFHKLVERTKQFYDRDEDCSDEFKIGLSKFTLNNPKHPVAKYIKELIEGPFEITPTQLESLSTATDSIQSIDLRCPWRATKNADALFRSILNFKNTTKLYLDGICTKGSDLESIGSTMQTLEEIYIKAKSTIKIDQRSLESLPEKIKSIFLENIRFGAITSLENCKFKDKIESIKLSNCGLIDDSVKLVEKFGNLKTFSLYYSTVTPNIKFYCMPKKLRALTLYGCTLDDNVCQKIEALKNITELNISKNWPITGTEFNKLPKSLEVLKCNDCNLSNTVFSQLEEHTNLKHLELKQNPITGNGIQNLPKQIAILDLQRCKLNDECLRELQHFKNMRALYLSHNKPITTAALSNLPASLEILEISNCGSLDDTVFLKLEKLVHLKKLVLSINPTLTGATIASLPRSIELLDLSYCDITNDACSYIESLSNITSLMLTGNASITDTGISRLPRTIKHLEISDCCKITDNVFKTLGTFTQLTTLKISNISSITGSQLAYLPKSVEILYIDNCNLTKEAIETLLHLPQLKVLSHRTRNVYTMENALLPCA